MLYAMGTTEVQPRLETVFAEAGTWAILQERWKL